MTTNHQSLHIEKLIPDCLFHIYEYLTPLDIANASLASDYLASFAESHIYKNYADCVIFDSFCEYRKQNYVYTILKQFGKHINKISFSSFVFTRKNKFKLDRLLQECPNLDELTLKDFDIDRLSKKCHSQNVFHLKHLFLTDCFNVNNGFQVLLKLLPNLNAITIRNMNHAVKAHILTSLYPIKHIEIVGNRYDDSILDKSILNKHKNYLQKLTLMELPGRDAPLEVLSNKIYKFPKLENLQIYIERISHLRSIQAINLRYLQLVGPIEDRSRNLVWSLSGFAFSVLEELELVNIKGSNIQIAADVPTIRELAIQLTNIDRDDGLSETVTKLPDLQRLRLRQCTFCPDELGLLIENSRLDEIEVSCSLRTDIIQLLRFLICKKSHGKPRFPCELRIISIQYDVSCLLKYH